MVALPAPPTLRDYAEAVRVMRHWQGRFFRTKRGTPAHDEAFWESRKAEKRVDQMTELLCGPQMTMEEVEP